MKSFTNGTLLRSWLRSSDVSVILSTPMMLLSIVDISILSSGCSTSLLHIPFIVMNMVMKNTIVPQSTPISMFLGLVVSMYIPATTTKDMIPLYFVCGAL